MPKVYIRTYGCQMNEADSEQMMGELARIGFSPAASPEHASLILLNTCAIRDSAEQKVYGEIGNLKTLKNRNPRLILGICGCVASKEQENIRKRFPWVDFVAGTDHIREISKLVKIKQEELGIPATDPCFGVPEEMPATAKQEKLKAFVTVIHGCNCTCTFCIVPFVRGKEVSRPVHEIVEEIRQFAEQGVKEVTLLGQNIAAYGHDLVRENGNKTNLARLLSSVHEVEDIDRIRFVTSHPLWMTDELIETACSLPKVCEYFHVPVQAGDDGVLKRMKRGYNTGYYRKRIEKIRSLCPAAAISTDIIAGFPGETPKEFENTLKLLRDIEFDNAFTFMYSMRSGTEAALMEEQIPHEGKKARLAELMKLVQDIALKKNQRLVGTSQEVLIEEEDKKHPGQITGRTRTNKRVSLPGGPELIGKLCTVSITRARPFGLEGKICGGASTI